MSDRPRAGVVAYFALAFAIAWIGCVAVAGPGYLRGEPVEVTDALLMFAAMLVGPSAAGLAMTARLDGRAGLRALLSRMTRWRVSPWWYAAAVLVFPAAILLALALLTAFVSREFVPVFTAPGIVVGLLAGAIEELGWMGFAYPRMRGRHGPLRAAVLLGLLHALWHLAADYLGASTDRGIYWLPHFAAMMIVSMTAMRVLLVWIYENTQSLLLAQLTHASSTGSLAVLVSTAMAPERSTLFYVVYAVILWSAAILVIARCGRGLSVRPRSAPGGRPITT